MARSHYHWAVLAAITVLLAALLAIARSGAPASAATFTVDYTADAVGAAPGDGVRATAGRQCSLRAAIQEARTLSQILLLRWRRLSHL